MAVAPMRILIVSDNHPPRTDGIAQSVAALVAGLRELGHQLLILTTSDRCALDDPPEVHRVLSVPALVVQYPLALVTPRTVRRLASEFQPDVVHVHSLAALGLAAASYARRDKIPLVLTWHTDVLAYRSAHKGLYAVIPACYAAWNLVRRPVRTVIEVGRTMAHTLLGLDVTALHSRMVGDVVANFDAVIVPSHKAARVPPLSSAASPPIVIPSAVLPKRPLVPHDLPSYRLARTAVARSPRTIAFVGRPSPEKNLSLLLLAFASHVLPRCPDAQLVVIGSYRGDRHYRRLARRLGISAAVQFLGSLPNPVVRHILGECSILALPSLTETQGIVLAEAASEAVPAVIVDENLDGIVCNGHTGILAPALDMLGTEISRLLLSDAFRRQLGNAAQEATRAYPAGDFARRVVAVYSSVLSARAAAPVEGSTV